MSSIETRRYRILGLTFRATLFAAAVSLAIYIPFKYATQLHAISGLYAFLFPLSAMLALAGMVAAWKPKAACECSTSIRTGVGGLSVLWLVTGLMCVKTLADGIVENPLHGTFASFHMLAQHVFLSLGLIAVALMPGLMARALGVGSSARSTGGVAPATRAPA